MDFPVDMFERSRLWDWSTANSFGTGLCEMCHRERPIIGKAVTRACGACLTLVRCYDKPEITTPNLRLQAQFIFVTEQRAIIWMNPNPNMALLPSVDVRVPAEGRSYLQDAFEFILDDKNRSEPYLFVNFYQKRSMQVGDLILNVDPDMLFISANRSRPDDATTKFKQVVDINKAKELLTVDFGKMTTKDRQRLIEAGHTKEEMTEPHWKVAQVVTTGSPKKWF